MFVTDWRGLVQLVGGLVLFGCGMGLVVRGAHGQGPWTVFHEGLSDHTPLTIGGATVVTGVLLLIIVLAMRVRIGLGTVLNVIVIGPTTDVVLWLVEEPDSATTRVVFTLLAPLVVGLGSALYLGVHVGPGPRDGVMTGLAARGWTIRTARFSIEAFAFLGGVLLGGTIGWGTAWWLIAIGPAVQISLPWFQRRATIQ
jgi:uncharacterized membrane protein YczE